MGLNSLQSTLEKRKFPDVICKPTVKQEDGDANIACGMIDALFDNIAECLKKDRSTVKINSLAKSFIQSSLDRTKTGIKEYLVGMYPSDLKILLDDIQQELNKRDDSELL